MKKNVGSLDAAELEAACRLAKSAPTLVEAARFALDKLCALTTQEFARGGDREIRERLAAALTAAGIPADCYGGEARK